MKPTKAADMPKESAACCTDPTKISLTSATRIVATARAPRATATGHGWSSCSPPSALVKNSLCVLSEKKRLSA